jgi:PAS domain S-box-containing protein
VEQKVEQPTSELARINETLKSEIAERKRTVAALKQAEDRIRLVIDTIPAMAWSIRPDGVLDFVNQPWLDYTGLSFAEAISEPTRSMHPDDLPEVMEKWRMKIAAGEPYEGEMRLRRADGDYRWFLVRTVPLLDDQGNIVKWYGTSADIEDRKRAETRGRELIDAIPQQIWSGPPDGTLDYCNDRWRSYMGLKLEDLRGDGWQSMLHPDDRERVLKAWRESVANGTPYEQEERHRGADGTYRWFLARGLPLRNAAGHIVRWYGTNTDIEDRKHAEEALRQTQAALARAGRITMLGEFTSTVAHEVNQPLGAVVTNAQASLRWLSGSSPNLSEAREALERIIRDGNRASEVIKRIRSLLKNGKPARTPFPLEDMIGEIVALTEAEAQQRRVSLQTRLEPKLPHIVADRVQLQQVLLNLVMNSLDALSEVAERPRLLTIEARAESTDSITISVQDTGIGINPRRMKEIFEPFYTTKLEGLGLGLSISRSIIEAHGGRFEVRLNQGPGVRFSFTLPAAGARIE